MASSLLPATANDPGKRQGSPALVTEADLCKAAEGLAKLLTGNRLAAIPVFATAIVLTFAGATLLLAAHQAVECGCFIAKG